MKQVAAEKKVPVIDLHTLTGDAMQQLGDAGCRPFFCSDSDRTHFSAQGAAWLALLLVAELKRRGLPPAPHCR